MYYKYMYRFVFLCCFFLSVCPFLCVSVYVCVCVGLLCLLLFFVFTVSCKKHGCFFILCCFAMFCKKNKCHSQKYTIACIHNDFCFAFSHFVSLFLKTQRGNEICAFYRSFFFTKQTIDAKV